MNSTPSNSTVSSLHSTECLFDPNRIELDRSNEADLLAIRPILEYIFEHHPIQEWVHAGARNSPATSLVVMNRVMAQLEGHDPSEAEGLKTLLALVQEPGTALDTAQALLGLLYDITGFGVITEERADAMSRASFACYRIPLAAPGVVEVLHRE